MIARLAQPLLNDEHETFDIMSAIGATDVLDGDIQCILRRRTAADALVSGRPADLNDRPD